MAKIAVACFSILVIAAIVLSDARGQGRRGPGAPEIQTFILQKGQSIRITPEGQVSIFTRTHGDPADLQRRSQPIVRGIAIWVGPDGTPRYILDQ